MILGVRRRRKRECRPACDPAIERACFVQTEGCGFRDIAYRNMTLGIVVLRSGVKSL